MKERKRRILQAITDDYIAYAEPVGSRTLAKKYRLGVSPATIRNEMADLEEGGYLRQPHTSAGRIPSDKGYRYYVDVLMIPEVISDEQRNVLRQEILRKQYAIEEMIRHASRLLALLTNEIAIVVAPSLSNSTFRHIQYIPIDPMSVLVILVVDPGFVQNSLVQLGGPISPVELERINHHCNRLMQGICLSDIGQSLVKDLKQVIEDGALFEATLELVYRGLAKKTTDRAFVEGSVNLLAQPEFRDVEKLRVLLEVLENTDVIMDAIGSSSTSGVRAQIGVENQLDELSDCSIVSTTYSINNDVVGAIGILGPTRMDYGKVFATVEYMAEALSELLSEGPGSGWSVG